MSQWYAVSQMECDVMEFRRCLFNVWNCICRYFVEGQMYCASKQGGPCMDAMIDWCESLEE